MHSKPSDHRKDYGSLHQEYEQLVQPHIASFDYFISEGLSHVVRNIRPIEVEHPNTKQIYTVSLSNPTLGRPTNPLTRDDRLLYPRECRQMVDLLHDLRRLTYGVPFEIDVTINNVRTTVRMGMVPIMVGCSLCSLKGVTKSELCRRGEEANDFGGYFIADGLEKVIRMLLTQKRHYIMALDRPEFMKNGQNFTSKATVLRCVRDDEVGTFVRCHFLKNDTVAVGISIGPYRFFLPSGILLRALSEVTDRELFEHLTSVCPSCTESSHSVFVAQQAEQCLAELAKYGMRTQHEAIEFLGSYYRSPLGSSASMSDYDVGMQLLQDYIFVHLNALQAKFHLLIRMIHKLYALSNSKCSADDLDSLASQEVVLSGFVYMKCLHELLRHYLSSVSKQMHKAWRKSPEKDILENHEALKKILHRRATEVGHRLIYLMKTGKFYTTHSRDLGQSSGIAIVAERVNFLRYIAHFRSIHKGSDFIRMRTTKPRKLLPDSWGFLCPVHTPDGLPCGLLLHLTANCRVAVSRPKHYDTVFLAICEVLVKNGMISIMSNLHLPPSSSHLNVILDGHVVGHIASSLALKTTNRLRWIKALNLLSQDQVENDDILELNETERLVPADMEIGYIPDLEGGMYPGLYLYTLGGRFLREVRQMHSERIELIGPLEQQHLSIQCPDTATDEITKREDYTHKEIHTKNILSILAALTPFSEFNQSPRNMYQCQMAKQTMGTPCHDLQFRQDTKLYRLQTPQSPICKTQQYQDYQLDEYPSGTNAVVAVISYTGYDMEDAMILNKASVDRGFARGCIYKTERHFLTEDGAKHKKVFMAEPDTGQLERPKMVIDGEQTSGKYPQNIIAAGASLAVDKLGVRPNDFHCHAERVDRDGLSFPGCVVYPGEGYCSVCDYEMDSYLTMKLKGGETAIVDQVTIVGNNSEEELSSANIRFRVDRTPVIGDKFASRAGQKGILSRMWSDIDLPYCSSTGMRPDIIINPHAFPSRMTIGMLIESITSKSAALQGSFVECSPFQQCDKPNFDNSVEVFGNYLEKAGFSRYGTETMTCGITGEEMDCDIYIGLVYYQRLRHMVSDKYQCRATGPVNALTRQPVKGRKAGGGIRFGEMERDSVISHGAAFVVNDRLMNSSDAHIASICTKCHSLVSPIRTPNPMPETERRLLRIHRSGTSASIDGHRLVCVACDGSAENIEHITIPYVTGVLIAELAAANISVKLYTQTVAS